MKTPFPFKAGKWGDNYFASWEVPQKQGGLPTEYRFDAILSDDLEDNFGVEASWGVEFMSVESGSKSGTDVLGTGSAFRIFATVAAILKDFIKTVKPEVFHFSAEESSRRKLYDKFAKRIKKMAGYDYTKFEGGKASSVTFGTLYVCSKKKLTLTKVSN
jgi:hypothetical protein